MSDRIESRLKEERRFHPGAAFANRARLASHHAYAAMHQQSIEDWERCVSPTTTSLPTCGCPQRAFHGSSPYSGGTA